MRFVSWNMGCGGKQSRYRKVHAEAWRFLVEELQPDIALLQETLEAPPSLLAKGRFISSATKNADNGAALFLARDVEAMPKAMESKDAFIAASNVTIAGRMTAIASLHLYPRSGKTHQDNLAALFEVLASSFQGQAFVVGGDLNASRRFDEVYGGKRYGAFFRAIDERGFHDCRFKLHGNEAQSFWGQGTNEAYQLDHFFVDAPSASNVQSCEVITTDETRRLSDHSPIVLELT